MMGTKPRSKAKFLAAAAYQYGFRLTVGAIPRALNGNDAGIRNNLGARSELRRLQRSSAATLEAGLKDERADHLREQGYLPIEPGYDRAFLASLVRNYREALADPKRSKFTGPRIPEAQRTVFEPAQTIPEIPRLLTPDMQRIIRAYYGAHLRVLHVRAWRNQHVGGKAAGTDVYSNLWHNDEDPVTLLRFFVYLTDGVTRETGATQLVPISVTRQAMRMGYLRRRAIVGPARRLLEDPANHRFFEGNTGSGFLLNPQLCLHRAGVPKEGVHRDIVQFTIAPADVPLPADWAPRLPPDKEILS